MGDASDSVHSDDLLRLVKTALLIREDSGVTYKQLFEVISIVEPKFLRLSLNNYSPLGLKQFLSHSSTDFLIEDNMIFWLFDANGACETQEEEEIQTSAKLSPTQPKCQKTEFIAQNRKNPNNLSCQDECEVLPLFKHAGQVNNNQESRALSFFVGALATYGSSIHGHEIFRLYGNKKFAPQYVYDVCCRSLAEFESFLKRHPDVFELCQGKVRLFHEGEDVEVSCLFHVADILCKRAYGAGLSWQCLHQSIWRRCPNKIVDHCASNRSQLQQFIFRHPECFYSIPGLGVFPSLHHKTVSSIHKAFETVCAMEHKSWTINNGSIINLPLSVSNFVVTERFRNQSKVKPPQRRAMP